MAIPNTNGIFIHNGLNCSSAYIPTAQSIPMSPSDSTTVKTVVDNKSDLSIIADEYDTSAIYTLGDFVIYDKVLYKCIMHSTTGVWDSTRWVAVNSKDSGINLKNSSGNNLVKIWEDSSGNGAISLYDKTTGYDTVSLHGYGYIDTKSITVMTSGQSNSGRIELTTTQSNSGYISLRDDNKNTPIDLNADNGNINAISLNGVTIGSSPKFTDTTYESKTASSGGTDLSLVTTGEKYTWNNKADKTALPPAYDTTSTYSTGDLVTYNNNIYQCKVDILTAEAWNPAHWTLVTPDTDYLHSINPNGNGSFSLNRKANTTIGNCSFAEGSGTTASGGASHSEGITTTASGLASHTEGVATTASEQSSHAEGTQTTASGSCTHAEGNQTTASGAYSHSEGLNTTANHRSQHTFGEYNVLDGSTASATSRGNYVEIVGNGTSSSARSNARTLDWSGNETLSGGLTSTSVSTTTLSATTLNGVTIGSSPKFTDTNNAVTQTATSTSADYEVLFSVTADNTTRTEGARKNSNLKFNPSTGNLQATKFNGYTLAGACAYGAVGSVASGNGNLVTSAGVYNAFTSRIKNSSSNRYFNSKTTMSYTGLSLTCPAGHVYIVQAWFRYVNGAPRRVGACHLNNVFAFYDTVAASLDAQDCGNASLTFRMYPGETVYYWAMYYNATQNFITENILDITL